MREHSRNLYLGASLDAVGSQEDAVLLHLALALLCNTSRNLLFLVKEVDVVWRNMQNRCAEQNFDLNNTLSDHKLY